MNTIETTKNLNILDERKKEQILESLLQDIIFVAYVRFTDTAVNDEFACFSSGEKMYEMIPELRGQKTFHNFLQTFSDRFVFLPDREKFYVETRRTTIMESLEEEENYVVTFRGRSGGETKYYQLKFTAEREDGVLTGFVAAVKIADNEVTKEREIQNELERLVRIRTYELQNSNRFLEMVNGDTVELFSMIIERRNQESGDHVRRVKMFTKALAIRMMKDYPEYGLTNQSIGVITLASALHDIGKISIPDEILTNPGKLTPREFEIMKSHCVNGAEVLDSAPSTVNTEYIRVGREICLYHHERWDGKGYPFGLKGDDIPISAQLVSLADCYEALTAERVYKKALHPDIAFDMILIGECGAFNPCLIECLKKCEQQFKRNVLNKELDYVGMASRVKLEGALKGLEILVVDTDPLSLESTEDLLFDEGAVLTCVDSNEKAIEYCIDEEIKYDAILIDIVDQKDAAIETIKRLRATQNGKPRMIPLIVLTTHTEDSVIRECVEAGADDFIEKPIMVSELQKVLMNVMRKQSASMEMKLKDTIQLANTDALTHTKNITAYTDAVADLADEIKQNANAKFSVVMLDLDNLKKVNDEYGHDVGDIYIKNGSEIFCDVFKHSPVFRIGGDEFVSILQGDDYEKRNLLAKQLKIRQLQASHIPEINEGKVLFSFGVADYDSNTDYQVSDVVKRADIALYDMKNSKQS